MKPLLPLSSSLVLPLLLFGTGLLCLLSLSSLTSLADAASGVDEDGCACLVVGEKCRWRNACTQKPVPCCHPDAKCLQWFGRNASNPGHYYCMRQQCIEPGKPCKRRGKCCYDHCDLDLDICPYPPPYESSEESSEEFDTMQSVQNITVT